MQATPAQINFLRVLHEERDLDFDADAYANATVEMASADIDALTKTTTDAPPTEEQLSEIAEIREFLGPRDSDTLPTDKLGAARLLRGLRQARHARMRDQKIEQLMEAGLLKRDDVSEPSDDNSAAVLVANEDIPF